MAVLHKYILVFLYVAGMALVCFIAWKAYPYYLTPLMERPFHDLYSVFRPAGTWGLMLGYLGTGLMLLLLLYSLRKRTSILGHSGSLSTWLNYHIFCGVIGPTLILFHTSFKLGGLVSVSFWSMMAVAISGVLGRYLYNQIPRSPLGEELSQDELILLNREMAKSLASKPEEREFMGKLLLQLTQFKKIKPAVWGFLVNLKTLRKKASSIRHQLIEEGFETETLARTWGILFKKARLELSLYYLADLQQVFHYWHVVHRPFALIMYLIMIVHIAIAFAFGIHMA